MLRLKRLPILITLVIVVTVFITLVIFATGRSDPNVLRKKQVRDTYRGPQYTYNNAMVNIDTLRLVQILHRHGDRSQLEAYPNDIHTEWDWPQGYGQLSKKGMRQTKELGIFLRKRYVDTGFLNPRYTRSQVYVRSTDLDRTLMSAYCVLSGLFPPDKNQTWDHSVAWQPIPVHTAPFNKDPLLRVQCPAYENAIKEARKENSLVPRLMEKYKAEISYISMHSGVPTTWEGVVSVLDAIYCQHVSGLALPKWVTVSTLQTILKFRDFYLHVERLDQTDYAYLKYGSLLGQMLDNMVNASSKETTLTKKFIQYSAHDTNIQGLTITMGIFNDRFPPYASCLLFELHEPNAGQFAVKILYRNETDHAPYPLTIPDEKKREAATVWSWQ